MGSVQAYGVNQATHQMWRVRHQLLYSLYEHMLLFIWASENTHRLFQGLNLII